MFVFVVVIGEKVNVFVVSKIKDVYVGNMIKGLVLIVVGCGGGKLDMVMVGGSDVSKIVELLVVVVENL